MTVGDFVCDVKLVRNKVYPAPNKSTNWRSFDLELSLQSFNPQVESGVVIELTSQQSFLRCVE